MKKVIANRDKIMKRLTKSLPRNHKIDRLLKEKNRLADIMNEMAEKADSILSLNCSADVASNPEYAEVKASFEEAENELKFVEVTDYENKGTACLVLACAQFPQKALRSD